MNLMRTTEATLGVVPVNSPTIPIDDWQFWIVTGITVGIVVVVFRPFVVGKRTKKSTRVGLTIDRSEPKK